MKVDARRFSDLEDRPVEKIMLVAVGDIENVVCPLLLPVDDFLGCLVQGGRPAPISFAVNLDLAFLHVFPAQPQDLGFPEPGIDRQEH